MNQISVIFSDSFDTKFSSLANIYKTWIAEDIKSWEQNSQISEVISSCQKRARASGGNFKCQRGFYHIIGKWDQDIATISDIEIAGPKHTPRCIFLHDMINTPTINSIWGQFTDANRKRVTTAFETWIKRPQTGKNLQSKYAKVGRKLAYITYFEVIGVAFTILFTENNFVTLLDVSILNETQMLKH